MFLSDFFLGYQEDVRATNPATTQEQYLVLAGDAVTVKLECEISQFEPGRHLELQINNLRVDSMYPSSKIRRVGGV